MERCLLIGLGNGYFDTASHYWTYTSGSTSSNLIAGDFDNDGDLDLASEIILYNNMDNGDTITDNDNYTGNSEPTVSPKPNLAPYKPSWWDDKILVSNIKRTRRQSDTIIVVGQKTYISFSYIINCNIASKEFKTKLYIDNKLAHIYTSDDYTFKLVYDVENNIELIINYLEYVFTTTGTHTIKVICDAENDVEELNEDDNEYTKTIEIALNKPNLTIVENKYQYDFIVVSDKKGTYTDDIITVGQTAYIDFYYCNNGNCVINAVKSKLYIDSNLVHTITLEKDLLPPERYTNTGTIIYGEETRHHINDLEYIFTTVGTYTIKVVCDSENNIEEFNENDNEYTKIIEVQDH